MFAGYVLGPLQMMSITPSDKRPDSAGPKLKARSCRATGAPSQLGPVSGSLPSRRTSSRSHPSPSPARCGTSDRSERGLQVDGRARFLGQSRLAARWTTSRVAGRPQTHRRAEGGSDRRCSPGLLRAHAGPDHERPSPIVDPSGRHPAPPPPHSEASSGSSFFFFFFFFFFFSQEHRPPAVGER